MRTPAVNRKPSLQGGVEVEGRLLDLELVVAVPEHGIGGAGPERLLGWRARVGGGVAVGEPEDDPSW